MTEQVRDFIIFSTADWKTRYWTNKQHNALALAERGHRVLYVETIGLRRARLTDKRDLRRLASRLLAGLRSLLAGPPKVRPRLWVLSPLSLPWGREYAVTRWLNKVLLQLMLARFCRSAGVLEPEIWTYHPFVLDAIERLPHCALIYQSVDDIAALPGVDAQQFLTAEQRLVRACDAVFTTARALERRYVVLNPNVYFVTNVVDEVHFGSAHTMESLPRDIEVITRPRLGYHGVISDQKIDVDLLFELALNHPQWQLVLIGDEREGQDPESFGRLRSLANVHFLGARDYRDLPAYLAALDVGLIPLARNDYTVSVYPMKLFEYLAAGVPVASTSLPYVADAEDFVSVGDGADGFAQAISAQLERGRLSGAEASQAVGEHTYLKRLDYMLSITAGIHR